MPFRSPDGGDVRGEGGLSALPGPNASVPRSFGGHSGHELVVLCHSRFVGFDGGGGVNTYGSPSGVTAGLKLWPVAGSSPFGDLRLVDDVNSADWIVASVRNFLHDVGSLLPVTFAAYGRVFHPAGRASAGGDQVEVPWGEVAAANGRIAHAVMEWVALTGDWRFMTEGGQPGVWDYPPSIGELPVRQEASLADILERFTTTPSECWFAVWEGYGDTPHSLWAVPRISMPQRPMVLLRGPLSAASTSFSTRTWPHSASLWWPQDRSWCVATDVDLMSTYVGGSVECIAALLSDDRLEAFAVGVDQTIHWRGDSLNPTPDPPSVPKVLPRRIWPRQLPAGPSSSTVTSRAPRPTPPGDTPGQ